MDRLTHELFRLFPAPDGEGRIRAMTLALSGPRSWEALSRVWQGVQAELQLPAPGIAVDGVHGYQLWFALAEPVAPQQAQAWLAALRTRYLAEVPEHRIAMFPGGVGGMPAPPPAQADPGRWSAFVASDLAALFADEPWLDLPPGADAQADLLSRLQPIKGAEWQRSLALLAPAPATDAGPAPGHQDPRRFLLAVMNDPAVDLRLRIEAAKALLPHVQG